MNFVNVRFYQCFSSFCFSVTLNFPPSPAQKHKQGGHFILVFQCKHPKYVCFYDLEWKENLIKREMSSSIQ